MHELEPMAASLYKLMARLEDLLCLLHAEQLCYWPDWGTLLGIERHRNVIPWDYDVDLCMPQADYERLIAVLEQAGGQIGELVLRKDYYDDPQGAVAILFADVPDESLGIDIVAYRQHGNRMLNQMSAQLQADYPGNYDFALDQVLPLRWGLLLGQPVLLPARAIERLEGLFGDWRAFPEGQAQSPLTPPPFQPMAEAAGDGPWIARAAPAAGGYVPGMRVARWLPAPDLACGEPEVTAGDLGALRFTDLVYRDQRALWGRMRVGLLFPGDVLHDADGGTLALVDVATSRSRA